MLDDIRVAWIAWAVLVGCCLGSWVTRPPRALRCGLCGADMALDPFHDCPGVRR